MKTNIINVNPISSYELEELGGYLFKFNSTAICIGIMGILGSIFLKERLYKEMGVKFPHLIISGEAGAGKSLTIKNIIMNTLSMQDEPNTASGFTRFTADKMLSSSNTLPFILEEYKPAFLKGEALNEISNISRSAYDRQSVSRGRKDGTIDRTELCAPIIIVGESSTNESAIIERGLFLTFSKIESYNHRDIFLKLREKDELKYLGRSILDKSLSITTSSLKSSYGSYLKELNERNEIKVDRIRSLLAVILLGIHVLREVFSDLNVDFDVVTGLKDYDVMDTLISTVIVENLDGNESTRTMVDATIEFMAASYHNNYSTEIKEFIHPVNKKEDNLVGIKLSKLHPIMTKYLRDFNIQDGYLGLSDLKKQIRKVPYFVSINGGDTYKINLNGTTGMYTIIDLQIMENSGIDIDGFKKHLARD